jgi:hypothetical protein
VTKARTIYVDDQTWDHLRQASFLQRRSISELIRAGIDAIDPWHELNKVNVESAPPDIRSDAQRLLDSPTSPGAPPAFSGIPIRETVRTVEDLPRTWAGHTLAELDQPAEIGILMSDPVSGVEVNIVGSRGKEKVHVAQEYKSVAPQHTDHMLPDKPILLHPQHESATGVTEALGHEFNTHPFSPQPKPVRKPKRTR